MPAHDDSSAAASSTCDPAFAELAHSLRSFVLAVDACDWDRADEALTAILGLDAWEARAATRHFAARIDTETDLLIRTMRLRSALVQGDALGLRQHLADCLGIHGPLADRVLAELGVGPLVSREAPLKSPRPTTATDVGETMHVTPPQAEGDEDSRAA